MIVASITEFTTRRRADQEKLEARLLPFVKRALKRFPAGGWSNALLREVARQYATIYTAEGGVGRVSSAAFRAQVKATLDKTDKPVDATAERLALWLATAILNSSTQAAAKSDPEPIVLEWVTMHDNHVRTAHRDTSGQQRPPGEPFDVDGVKMAYPGDPSAPPALWINCRCSLAPVSGSQANALVAAAPDSKPMVIVALPAADDPVHAIGDEVKHMTLIYLGKDSPVDRAPIHDAVQTVASQAGPMTADVSGQGTLGPDGANVWICESPMVQAIHDVLINDPAVGTAFAAVPQSHPHFVPHVTSNYGDAPAQMSDLSTITFDRLAVWDGSDQTEYPMGDPMTDTTTEVTDAPAPATGAPMSAEVPWHGVLAPEGVWSGDKRQFAANSLRFRDLPIPLTWQKASSDGHAGSVVVGRIDSIERVGNLMNGSGVFLTTPEADEAVGLVAEFGKFGVSIDADDAEFDFNEETSEIIFSSARIASASMVPIPAFAEAYVSLGGWPDEETIAAAGEIEAGRGPGWITNPVPTRRIHDYWTVPGQPGYEKIQWGVAGDFNRCRVEVGSEIAENSPDKVRFLNQICAQWHHDATGFWPGRAPTEQHGSTVEASPALSLVASGAGFCAPSEWFEDPKLPALTPLTISDNGRVFGHLAGWSSCHIGYEEMCVAPPSSASEYAYFRTGEVLTDNGVVATGSITIGGGHATGTLRPKAAMAHYDSTSSVVADVACGEDEHGIWLAGWKRPGVSDEQVNALRASALSGDWRRIGGEMELVAALAVNVPGFMTPRVGVHDGLQVALVAAGVVEPTHEVEVGTLLDMNALASLIVSEMSDRETRKNRMAALAARVGGQ